MAVLGPDMRRLMVEHPEIATRLVIALGPAAARDQRAPRAPVLPDACRAASRWCSASWSPKQLAGQGRAAGGDVPITATQADLAQLAGSSRESASRFLAVLERAGVISQGRGRLVVHDPEALRSYVF